MLLGVETFSFEGWQYHVQYTWLPTLMDHQIKALPSTELLMWERALARYPSFQQWLALDPSPGQEYQPFSLPRPEQ